MQVGRGAGCLTPRQLIENVVFGEKECLPLAIGRARRMGVACPDQGQQNRGRKPAPMTDSALLQSAHRCRCQGIGQYPLLILGQGERYPKFRAVLKERHSRDYELTLSLVFAQKTIPGLTALYTSRGQSLPHHVAPITCLRPHCFMPIEAGRNLHSGD